jgi:uncharacterized protein YwqG
MSAQPAKILLPPSFEPFRDKLEATALPYLQIKTHITQAATLWQSKFLGLPYLPKSTPLPQTPQGDYLSLLAQINFAETHQLEGFPKQGLLQFYIAPGDLYGADFDHPTRQNGFRVLYHAEPEMDESALITDFDWMPSPWKGDESTMPFEVFSKYLSQPKSCFALTFERKISPISLGDYQYSALVGHDSTARWTNSEADADEYNGQFVGHRLGGYPLFTQTDPRAFLPQSHDPYRLLLQIDSESNNKIDILWGDTGICNFFIRQSALEQLDFSEVIYNWDCC